MSTDTETTEHNQSYARVKADGGNAPVTAAELTLFKNEVKALAHASGYSVTERRDNAADVRYSRWEGQSADGRKHRDALDGEAAFPFEGASDARIRLADMIVNEHVLVLTASAMRAVPRVRGLDLSNEALGHKLTTLMRWIIRNKWGARYLREVTRLAQYQEGDSPAGAVAGVWWEQETALEMQSLNLEQLAALLVQTYGLSPEQVQALYAQLQDPTLDDATAEALRQAVPTLSEGRSKKVVKALREENQAEFPAPYLRRDEPVLTAYRLFEDFFMPTNTGDLQRVRCAFIREWLSASELYERVVSADYSEEFVEELLKHEGKTAFPRYQRELTGELTLVEEQDPHANKGLYEVLTVVYSAVNEDYIPGKYYFPFSTFVDEAAHERRLLDYDHGEYPFTWFGREILTGRLLDSRGVPELVATEQNSLKLLHDSFSDHVSLTTLPNIKVPRRRGKLSVNIGPLILIKEDRPGDVTWMQPPTYPQGNENVQAAIRLRVSEYFGRIANEVSPLLTQLHQTGRVTNFLASLGEALGQALKLAQQYLSEETLQKITGDDGIPIAKSREEIQGEFAVELSFDPRDLDMSYLKEVMAIIVQLLQMDTVSSVVRDQLVGQLLTAINPQLAARTWRPADVANANEVQDEENNFAKIASGVEPPMVAEGLNFPLRLQVLTSIPQKNPEALAKMTPKSREIYQARVEYLQNQVQQMKNAQIGRSVGQPALGQ
jgi:hypothetical protein